MPDSLFFPATAMAALALIALALAPLSGRKPTGPVSYSAAEAEAGYNQAVVSGDLLYKIVAGGRADITLSEENGEVIATIAAGAGLLPDDPVKGPHFRLGADLENVHSGRTVIVTLSVRPEPQRGASAVLVNYSTGALGESGWQTLPLQPDWTDVSFSWKVPMKPDPEALGVDYLAIRPEVPEKTRAIQIRMITLTWTGEPTP
jgi:hypothetical protein